MKHILLSLFLLLGVTAHAESNYEQVDKTLNALHHNASTANFEEYFNLYHNNAVFIGTDASEVWSKEEFQAYAKPHFDKGKGWTYHPRDRHIYFSSNKDVAWFDELLDNDSLGETRGTGVLVKEGDVWRVTQYHLTIPIPNALADSIAEQIKSAK
ncbi:nuclear transport factor 2 family protein [Alteromonas gracilis]|uniref:nuclear transport factor 2 family protein n=1 Tax=Alteromonas gracilis TaxID=1479524 RepID=UPI0037361F5C